MSFPAYPEYKDSGSKWIGQIPVAWEVARASRIYGQSRQRADEGATQLAATQKYGVIPQSQFIALEDNKPMLAIAGTENFKTVKAGDFVISLRSFQGGIEHSVHEGCVSPAYTVLKLTGSHDQHYSRWLLKSVPLISALNSVVEGIRDGKTIAYDQFAQLEMPIPQPDEQRAIAAFLDCETAKIDAAVAAQERLIALLAEMRAATISHAVTKGLEPDAPMKDSGIEWLGQIPAHWNVAAFKHYARVLPGYAFPADQFSEDENDWRLLRGINISPSGVRWQSDTVYWERSDGDRLEAWELEVGDLVIGMDRPWISGGLRAATIRESDLPALVLQRVAAIRASGALPAQFLLRCLQHEAFFHFCAPDLTGVSVPHLSGSQIEEFRIPVPPKAEADSIAKFVEQKSRDLLTLQRRASKSMKLLKERRAALISAAVTGKIDVRGEVEAHQQEAA